MYIGYINVLQEASRQKDIEEQVDPFFISFKKHFYISLALER